MTLAETIELAIWRGLGEDPKETAEAILDEFELREWVVVDINGNHVK